MLKEHVPCEHKESKTSAGQIYYFYLHYFTEPGFTFHVLVVLKLFILYFSYHRGTC